MDKLFVIVPKHEIDMNEVLLAFFDLHGNIDISTE